jgi:hypothetical protein
MNRNSSLTLTRTAFAAALGLALAGPAFAQSNQGTPSQGTPSQAQHAPGQQVQGGTASQSNSGQQRSQAQVMSQDKIRQQLAQAGFQDVRILDAAYLVQAKTQEGNTVLMMIDPPHANQQSSNMPRGSQGSGGSGASTPSSPASSGGSGSHSGSGQGR